MWSCDSDVAAMCPRYVHFFGMRELYFKTGTGKKKRYIPMHIVAENLGSDMSSMLPAIHALSGCDSTSAFFGIGKQKWLTTLRENRDILQDLQEFGNDPVSISEQAMTALVALTSLLYGKKRYTSLNHLRYDLFSQKRLSSERLPPTMDAFAHHVKRANYQSYIWLHAHMPFLNVPSPKGHGWKQSMTGELAPVLMTSEAAPKAVLALSECHCKTDCSTRRCLCRKESLVCSDSCSCDFESCSNRLPGSVSDSSDDESQFC